MKKSTKTFIEGKPVSVYADYTSPDVEHSPGAQDEILKLQCLELAVQLKGVSPKEAVKAAKRFYAYITAEK